MIYAESIKTDELIIMFKGKKKFINKATNEISIKAKISWYENNSESFSSFFKKKDPRGVNKKAARNEYM